MLSGFANLGAAVAYACESDNAYPDSSVTAMGITSVEWKKVVGAYVERTTGRVAAKQGRRNRSHDRSCEDPLCRVDDHVLAIQVIHKGDGPKLPYQAVVIRQSAIHR